MLQIDLGIFPRFPDASRGFSNKSGYWLFVDVETGHNFARRPLGLKQPKQQDNGKKICLNEKNRKKMENKYNKYKKQIFLIYLY